MLFKNFLTSSQEYKTFMDCLLETGIIQRFSKKLSQKTGQVIHTIWVFVPIRLLIVVTKLYVERGNNKFSQNEENCREKPKIT